jgi:hypothetical protein
VVYFIQLSEAGVLPVSLKMDKIEYRAVIKCFVKEGLTPNEIHSKVRKGMGQWRWSIAGINVLVLREIMLKNENNFEIINSFFHC